MMPHAPLGWLIVGDLLCVSGGVIGALTAYRRPVLLRVFFLPLYSISLLPYAVFLGGVVFQAVSGDKHASTLTILALVTFVFVAGFASGAGAVAMTNRRAAEWWLEQQIARHDNLADAPKDPSLSDLNRYAPPAAQEAAPGWVVLSAVVGAIGMVMPWLLR